MRRQIKQFVEAIALLLLLPSCTPIIFSDTSDSEQTRIACDFPNVVTPATQQQQAVTLYVDGTPSMQGFVSNRNSRYVQTLETLESLFTTTGDRPKYYRLGLDRRTSKAVREIGRDDYLRATLPEFYGSGRFPALEVSQIEAAIAQPSNANTLTIVVTDLYQQNDDVTRISQRLRDQYLNAQTTGQAIGIIGIRSEFSGTVYTEDRAGGQSFVYNSAEKPGRPFYILFVGQFNAVNSYLTEVIDKFSSDPAQIQAVIFSADTFYQTPSTLKSLESSAELTPELRNHLTIPAISMKQGQVVVEVKQAPIQMLQLITDDVPSPLPLTATLSPYPHVLGIRPDHLTATVTSYEFDPSKQTIAPINNAELSNVIRLENFEPSADRLLFQTQINPQALPDNDIYLFKATLTINPNDPLAELNSWEAWNATSGTTNGAKTSNLLSFLEQLRALATNVLNTNPPILGQFCYIIHQP